MSLDLESGTLHPNHDVLRLEGEIDVARRAIMIDDIESRLRQHPQLTIDFSAVTFIDCTGLGTLLWAHTRAEDFGGGLALVGPCAALSRILKLTALEHVLRLQPATPDPQLG